LYGADLGGANLYGAKLQEAILREADLREADLSGANLRNTDLCGANLRGAYLSNTDLSNTDLCEADLSGATLPDFQICPEEGDFIAWKKVRDDIILKLRITGERTSNLVGRKCRASKVIPLKAYDMEGNEVSETEFFSIYEKPFIYELGVEVEEPNYDSDIRVKCSSGIHFFMTMKEAIEY
jgi:hypothetical protein